MQILVSRLMFHGSWKRAEHDADGRGSFAAIGMVNVGQALSPHDS